MINNCILLPPIGNNKVRIIIFNFGRANRRIAPFSNETTLVERNDAFSLNETHVKEHYF